MPVTCKLLEIRDAGTFIPAMAIKVDALYEDMAEPASNYLLMRAGWLPGMPGLYLARLEPRRGQECNFASDPEEWGTWSRTMRAAHYALMGRLSSFDKSYQDAPFEALEDGAVLDVEYLLGETSSPKSSEALEVPADISRVMWAPGEEPG